MGDESPPDDLTAALAAGRPGALTPPAAPPPVHWPTTGGTRLRWILFLLGLAGLALGAVAIRSAVLLSGRIDPDLVTTPELEAFSAAAIASLLAVVVLGLSAAGAGARWAERMRGSLAAMTDMEPLLEPAPRTGRLALGLVAGGLALVMVAAAVLLLPFGRDVARLAWVVTAVGALVLPIGAGLLIWLIGDIERREALLIHAVHPWQLAPGDRDRRWPIAAIAALAVFAIIAPSANVPYLWSDHVCHAADLECRWIVVQADQLANDPRGSTTILHYGIRRATKERQGTLVIASGGPGVSGIYSYAGSEGRLDPRLTDAFDIVAFDPRGVGESGYRDCPAASQRYQASLWFDVAPAVIDDFVTACVDETEVDPARLADYASAQVAEDVETIRRDLGVERIALYGESYGTVVAQRYAVAHPDHLEALILDGPIDIEQPTDASWVEAAAGFEDVLDRSLEACGTEVACDFNHASVWKNILGSLKMSPVSASYADVDGVVTGWPLTEDLVRETLIDAMYDVSARMLALRALSAAEAGDWVPMARLVYSGISVTQSEAVSDFAYYATSCADRHSAGSESDAAHYLAELKTSALRTSRAGSVYLSSAACHAWPLPAPTRPPVTVPSRADFPVVILTATGDPITPPAHGQRIADRYRTVTDTYLVETQDGPHVTFGRGQACPDGLVVGLLTAGTRPSTSRSSCPGELIAPFLELSNEARSEDPLIYRATALDLELLAHPDYLAWDGLDRLTIGCRFGGKLEVTASNEGDTTVEDIEVDGCAVIKGEPMTGSGVYRGPDEAEFEVRFPDGELTYRTVAAARYTMDERGSAFWEGRYLGRTYDGRR
jgi:pimeloyl-ACP methyl ester carboxylesterase